MIATITSIQLKAPLKFFSLSLEALKITNQLKASRYKAYKKRGFWTTHYTMTLWNSEEEMKTFAFSGAHLEAMKKSREIAREIRVFTYETQELPDWPEAKRLLKENGKVFSYTE